MQHTRSARRWPGTQTAIALLVLLGSTCAVEIITDAPPDFTSTAKGPRYIIAVDVEGTAPPLDPAMFGGAPETVVMTDKQGRKFSCALPASPTALAGHAGQSGQEGQASNLSLSQEKTPSELLDALGALCFYRLEDWWTYELCYKKHVRQFHKERDQVAADYSLGQYDAEASDTDVVHTDDSKAGKPVKYVRHVYSGGEDCDLTGQQRATEVRFLCDPDAKDSITSMHEPTTCQYVITFASPRLCQHAAFREDEGPRAHILCTRLLSDADRAAAAEASLADAAGSAAAALASTPSAVGSSMVDRESAAAGSSGDRAAATGDASRTPGDAAAAEAGLPEQQEAEHVTGSGSAAGSVQGPLAAVLEQADQTELAAALREAARQRVSAEMRAAEALARAYQPAQQQSWQDNAAQAAAADEAPAERHSTVPMLQLQHEVSLRQSKEGAQPASGTMAVAEQAADLPAQSAPPGDADQERGDTEVQQHRAGNIAQQQAGGLQDVWPDGSALAAPLDEHQTTPPPSKLHRPPGLSPVSEGASSSGGTRTATQGAVYASAVGAEVATAEITEQRFSESGAGVESLTKAMPDTSDLGEDGDGNVVSTRGSESVADSDRAPDGSPREHTEL